MPLQKPYDHAIDFMEGTKLSKPAKVYLLFLAERNSLDTWINEELRKGYIYLSTSPIAAPFFFVKKHDGSLRPVIDYKALNAITIKNRYPIPRIANLIESLSKASIFKIDLRWGYNNVCIKEGIRGYPRGILSKLGRLPPKGQYPSDRVLTLFFSSCKGALGGVPEHT